jgi:hypothetical protein
MTYMKWMLKALTLLPAAFALLGATRTAQAAPCADLQLPRPLYGAGGSATTPTLKLIATALANLPEDERVTIFFSDPGACTGYEYFRNPDPLATASYRYWDAAGDEHSCDAPQTAAEFVHMGNTPALCPGDVPLPEGAKAYISPVQTINVIANYASLERSITAEALYHIFGFGPGATGRTVTPWDQPNAVFVRRTSSFVHQIIAQALGVPSGGFKLPAANFLQTNPAIVDAVFQWGSAGDPQESLGYVSGSNAVAGEKDQHVRTLAYQHYDQSCPYLPDSEAGSGDRANVRSGQYFLWTPGWLYALADDDGLPEDPLVRDFVGWFTGTVEHPSIDVQELIVQAGDVPLCAMHAIRPKGDLSAIQSYAPDEPCHGWYEFTATGETDYQTCDTTDDCDGKDDGEVCRLGYCEAY